MSRVVLGYHGTTREVASAVLGGAALRISRNRWDWLGDGVYFWEYGPVRAWEWAQQEHGGEAAVLRASIRLEDCLDLADLPGTRELKRAFDPFRDRMERAGMPLPAQRGRQHDLDRAVVNFLVDEMNRRIRVVRAPFVEGERLWAGSDLWGETHVQLAVRDLGLLSGLGYVEAPENERF